MWTREALKERARAAMKNCYWQIIVVSLILNWTAGGAGASGGSGGSGTDFGPAATMNKEEFLEIVVPIIIGMVAIFLVSFAFSLALSAFALNPLQVGARRFMILASVGAGDFNEISYAFSNSYKNVVKVMFFRWLYSFLWGLLFVIPGIVKSYEYRMIPQLLAENPALSKEDAFALSKQMMDGEKWNTFVLDLSFLGWIILGLFTCGALNVFYVNPYIYLTEVQLYFVLKQKVFGSAYGYGNAAYAYGNGGYNPTYGQNYTQAGYNPTYGQNYPQAGYNPTYGQNYPQAGYTQSYGQNDTPSSHEQVFGENGYGQNPTRPEENQ